MPLQKIGQFAVVMDNPYPVPFVKVMVPAGESFGAVVTKFDVSEDDVRIYNLREAWKRGAHRIVPPGAYTRLRVGGELSMTDTPAEAWENLAPITAAQHVRAKRVLLNGLGLGFVLDAILCQKTVHVVRVVERSEGVIRLVGPHYADNPRVELVHADALDYKPKRGERFDVVWHDIWNNRLYDPRESHFLHHRYARIAAWQGSWGRP